MKVFLVGFMGSGKSSLGTKLAARLDLTFIDLDVLIETQENQTISQIFSQKGEGYFREMEQKCLFSLSAEVNTVVSLGGGAACNDAGWNFIKENGLVIYVKESPEILFGRLRKLKSNRPLISALNDEQLKAFIEEKLKERSLFYEKADFIYEKEKSSYAFLVSQIENYLR